MGDEETTDGTVGTRVKALREDAGLSQRALARLAGTAAETIARLERNPDPPPRPGTVRKLAAALDVPPEALTGGSEVAGAEAADIPARLRAALVAAGIPPGPAGDDLATLVAAIEARSWRFTVEERAPSQRGRNRYQAMVFGSAGDGAQSHASARASGETEAAALATALVRLMERTR